MADKRAFAIAALEKDGAVIIRCNGNSMRGIIEPQEAIHLRKVDPRQLRVGDAVFCRVKGSLTVHKITSIENDNRFTIGNNHGYTNGTIGAQAIFGLATQIEDRILVSKEELAIRLKEGAK